VGPAGPTQGGGSGVPPGGGSGLTHPPPGGGSDLIKKPEPASLHEPLVMKIPDVISGLRIVVIEGQPNRGLNKPHGRRGGAPNLLRSFSGANWRSAAMYASMSSATHATPRPVGDRLVARRNKSMFVIFIFVFLGFFGCL